MPKYRLVEETLMTPSRETVLIIRGPGKNRLTGLSEENMRVRTFRPSQRALAEEILRDLNTVGDKNSGFTPPEQGTIS